LKRGQTWMKMANPTEGPLLTGCWLLPIPARDSGIFFSGFF
jgi:hypothetical protein